MYLPPVPTEDSWDEGTPASSSDLGTLEGFRWLMESVKARDIHRKDITWVVGKYTCLSAAVQGGFLGWGVLDDPSEIVGRYAVELERSLRRHGIGFVVFNGLTPSGWDRYKQIA